MDEGIEAMLCCWLQQLQEFGGPEVEKPDLLKGSIGSLKNLGLASASSKAGTAASSLAKQKTVLDMRARYNVSRKHILFLYGTNKWKLMLNAQGLRF